MMKHEEKMILRENCFDAHGNLLPREVLFLFETLAGHHAEALGVGFSAMLERNLLWVIRNIRYQVCGELVPGSEVVGMTWPLPQTKVGFVREYLICDAAGNALIKGTSGWVLIYADTRQLAVAAEVYPDGEYCLEKNFADKTRRISDFAAEEAMVIYPDASSIDANEHVNNTCYADFAHRALGDFGGRIDTFQIDYQREVLCGEEIRLYAAKNEGSALVKGVLQGDQKAFACCVTLKL